MSPFFMAISIDGVEVEGARGQWVTDQTLDPLAQQPQYKFNDDLTAGEPVGGKTPEIPEGQG